MFKLSCDLYWFPSSRSISILDTWHGRVCERDPPATHTSSLQSSCHPCIPQCISIHSPNTSLIHCVSSLCLPVLSSITILQPESFPPMSLQSVSPHLVWSKCNRYHQLVSHCASWRMNMAIYLLGDTLKEHCVVAHGGRHLHLGRTTLYPQDLYS